MNLIKEAENAAEARARTRYVTGLREVADLIESTHGVELPLGVTFYVFCDNAEHMAEVRRAFGGTWAKRVDNSYFNLERKFGSHTIQVTASREKVCERVVVGTEPVVVPDVDNAPTKVVDREIVEWHCPQLLAGDD